MKNFKKVLALVLSLAMIISTFTVSFAAETMTDAEVTEALGLIKGDGDGVTDEYLASESPRWKIAIMTLRLQGLYEEALAFEGTETFEDAEDMTWVAGRAILAYLKANPELGWIGNDNKIDPNGMMTVQQYYKVMLETLGYKQGTDFEWAEVMDFAAEKGLVVAADAEDLTMADVAAVTVEVLHAENSEGTKLVEALVEAGAIDEAVAGDLGLVEVAASEVAIKSAVALNSKVVQVTLTDAAEEVVASQFTVVDEEKAAVEVASAELAPWSTDNKVVLVTLATETKSGDLYSVTSGDKTVNFGGRSADTTAPALDKSEASDYNEFKIKFTEAVRIDGLMVKASEKYGSKATLEVLGMEYIDSKTIKVITSEQKSVLYGIEVSGAIDLAGNEMKEDTDNTFVGIVMPTTVQKVVKAKAIDYNQVYVEFGTNVDPNSISDATFEIQEMYGSKTEVAVFEAAQATTAQTVEYDAANNTAELKADAVKVGVVLTVDGVMNDNLYKVTVDNMKTLYGKDMSSTSSEKETTFVGMKKPTGSFGYDSENITVTSATSIEVKYARKIDKDLAEDIANYTINAAYGDKEELAVLGAELKDDQKTVKLTVGEMKNVLYKLTTKNLVDIYGNTQKTGADADKTFVGSGKEAKISAINAIVRTGNVDTQIKVTFNAKVGDNATDVALYTISGGVGYPEAVELVSGDANSVILTIPKTTETVSYTLTVKGLNNADGVAMDADGVKKTFTGKGLAKGLPVVQAVMPVDRQTVKIYFDREVTDSTIKGVIWDGSNLNSGFFVRKANTDSASFSDVGTNAVGAYQDSKDKNALVVVSGSYFWNTSSSYTTYKFDLDAAVEGKKVKFDSNVTEIEVAAKGDVYTYPIIEGVQGVDNKTMKVYFSKPVTSFDAADITIRKTSDSNVTVANTATPIAVSGSGDKEWLVPTTGLMEYISYSATFDHDAISDKYVTAVKVSKSATEQNNEDVVKEFAGNGTDVNYITGVYAMMTDDRTIDVYYPESMKYDSTSTPTGSVDDKAYYSVSVSTVTVPNVEYVTYNATDRIATLYLDNAFDASVGTFDLVVDTNIANLTGNKTVAKSSSDNADLSILVAKNTTTTNEGPALSDVSVTGDRMKINITMDQPVVVATNNSSMVTKNGSASTVTFADFEKVLQVSTVLVDQTSSTPLTSGDVVGDVALSADSKTFTITLSKAIKAGAEGTVTTKTQDATVGAKRLFGFAGVARLTTDKESKIVFAAPNSSTFDFTAPIASVPTVTVGSYKAGAVIPVTVTFDDTVVVSGTPKLATNVLYDHDNDVTTATIASNAVYASGSGTNTLVFNYTVIDGTNTTAFALASPALVDGTIKDNAGNVADMTAVNSANLNTAVIDTTIPAITSVTSATYNKTTGALVITVTDALANGDSVDVTKIVVNDSSSTLGASADQATYTLTALSSGTVTGATTLSITLTGADQTAVNNGTGTITLTTSAGLIKDAAGNVSTGGAGTNITVTVS